jgi:tetratricopeptide (TPR) repeat protein
MSKRRSSIVFLAAALAASLAAADGGGGSGTDVAPNAPEVARAVQLIDAGRFQEAIPVLQAHVDRSPNDASAQNWLGFANRKAGNLDAAFKHYARALAIDPKHRGAHEYVGEAYLMVGNLPKAEEHLKALDKLCFLPCTEHTDLKKAIAAYKANGNRVVTR